MSDWIARNQINKAVVWEYWQRMNHARPQEVAGIVDKAFHKDVDWNGPQPINQIRGSEALVKSFWQPLLHSFPDIKRKADILMGGVDNDEDCDDTDPAIGFPTVWYEDSDGDLFGNANVSVIACAAPPGFVADDTDCRGGTTYSDNAVYLFL